MVRAGTSGRRWDGRLVAWRRRALVCDIVTVEEVLTKKIYLVLWAGKGNELYRSGAGRMGLGLAYAGG